MKRSILLTSIVFACLLGVFSTRPLPSVTAQAPSPQDSRWIEFPEMRKAAASLPFADLPKVTGDGTQSNLERPPADDQTALPYPNIGLYSKMVYQQWIVDNYEIILANGDGNNPVRLTVNSASDLRPVLSPDLSKIYFSSDRDGNFEIYSMNLDGSDVRRLTNHPKTDTRPSVSPDGKRIAFISNRGSEVEIYLMNTDGSGVAQLTSAPPSYGAYDCDWSPDGSQIVFTAMNSQGLGYIHTINLATRAVNRAHYNQLYLLYDPSWAPGGSNLIAFDAIDPNGTYALSKLYTVVADGSGNQYAQARTNQGDYYVEWWVSTWLHDPRYLLADFAEYTRVDDYLYLDRVTFRLYEVQSSITAVYSFPNPGFTMDADWGLTDRIPPASRMNPLPPFSRGGMVKLSWTGDPTGNIPIASYRLASNTGLMPDDVIITTLPGTQTSYISSGGAAVTWFTVTATDEAGQSEPEPPTADRYTSTRLYSHEFSGIIQDHNGAPLGNIPIISQPNPLNSAKSDGNGQFLAYLDYLPVESPQLQINTSASGYGALPVTPFAISSGDDLQYDLIFPPQNDLILNGNFESTDLNPWDTLGTLSSGNETDFYYSGVHSASVGGYGAQYMEPSGNSYPMVDFSYLDLKIDPDGRGVIFGKLEENLVVIRQLAGGEWSGPDLVAAVGSTSISNLHLLIADEGLLTACWTQDTTPYCKQQSSDGDWQPPVTMPTSAVSPTYILDRTGRLYSYNKNGIQSLLDTGLWSNVEKFPGTANIPVISFDLDNNPLLVDFQYPFVGVYKRIDGAWQPEQGLPLGPVNITSFMRWETNRQGWSILYFKFDYSGSSYFTIIRKPDGSWSRLIQTGPLLSDVRIGPNGELLLRDVYGDIFLYERLTGWKKIARYSSNNGFDIGFTPWGEFLYLHNVYVDGYYTTLLHQSRAVENGDGSLSQTVTIPANAHRPTLSFLYRLLGMQDSPGSSFEVTLSDGVDTTPLFTQATGVTDWEHQSVDLSAWAGQTVTLNFALHQAAGGTLAELNLDEVSLGDWLTPWVKSVEPNSVGVIVPPMQITIHGDNFTNIPAVWLDAVQIPSNQVAFVDDNTLTVTLTSPSLRPGDHVIKVINPSGHAGALPKALHTGVQVFLPTIRR